MSVMPNKNILKLFEFLNTVNTAINTNQSINWSVFNSWTYNKQVYNGFRISYVSLVPKSSWNVRFILFHNMFTFLCV